MASHVQLFDGRPVVSSIPGRPAVCHQLPLGSNAVARAPAVTEEQEEEDVEPPRR